MLGETGFCCSGIFTFSALVFLPFMNRLHMLGEMTFLCSCIFTFPASIFLPFMDRLYVFGETGLASILIFTLITRKQHSNGLVDQKVDWTDFRITSRLLG